MNYTGIEFEMDSSCKFCLKDILRGIDVSEFDWYFIEYHAYTCEDNKIKEFDVAETIAGNQIEAFFNTTQNNFIQFALIHAYPKGATKQRLMTYCDYVNSDCQLILVVINMYYYEIYAKNLLILEKLTENIRPIAEHMSLKTPADDVRTIIGQI